MPNANILSLALGKPGIGIGHHLKSVLLCNALKIRFAVSSLTLFGSRKIPAIHKANVG